MVPSFAFAGLITLHAEALIYSTTRKEFSMKMLFQYSDNQERGLKH